MQTNILGYPRIGSNRELKKANEAYWTGKISLEKLQLTARQLRRQNWETLHQAGIDLIPSNDFSYYDQILDMCIMTGAIPARFQALKESLVTPSSPELYFAMARGYQKNGFDATAMEMTKWFDTNYHYLVPEFDASQEFSLLYNKCLEEFKEAQAIGIHTKPVLVGPVSFLLLGKIKEESLQLPALLDKLLPVYIQVLQSLYQAGATWIQIDEPTLVLDLTPAQQDLFLQAYAKIRKAVPALKLLLTTYFGGLQDNTALTTQLPVDALHIDLVRAPEQLDTLLAALPAGLQLSVGVVNGRNIWKNNYDTSLLLINKAIAALGRERVLIATSCSLLHTPYDLELETDESVLTPQIKNWMAFAKQKVYEVIALKDILNGHDELLLQTNQHTMQERATAAIIHKPAVKARLAALTPADAARKSIFTARQKAQEEVLQLPLFPTTTIGSFPQTEDIRKLRADLKKGDITKEGYDTAIRKAIQDSVQLQESLRIDVLVHGEFERNDMVEYFGEQLEGFVFTKNGWVQSYGSRCVKPPVIYGDVQRSTPMTVEWSSYAQSLTNKPMKGMLTGPVTILQWSFVRDDQPRAETTLQIALAIRDEVVDLEQAGIRVIQVDEPAIREGLPLRQADWQSYLDWAVKAFRVSVSGVEDATQIHTHMCYSEFNDIISNIAAMDADVITIETSRSQMELLEVFSTFHYPYEIGPGVYDIHSPRVPTVAEMTELLEKAIQLLPARNIWVNPDCGLKTRKWPETEQALRNMVAAARNMRVAVQTMV
ncbi:5-methyltetrahydropteroyltriglutamate--homocysteine S-methyltransferase [Chitinophaga pinensis]|uniref:5-methyltetrahydropteroyltriglutamate--homocysteine methyltransferase n=1 Tax=Chitinophaga pinensis (strain ATCC 43595 / DSM 2588 / LMG 13176 / NBRC 15968 / NCIMB 11800 / UQM 2034) TaxID=485918 RepID=A0A979GAJ3_CHIPD|nr:5-methyltetrahydropteroyltriglutamate--homocysteine S-methyltransferase [Chitinophaga pinensis]ACU63885.1 5-methyltetrahydropteroyltriglutamate/homocystei neS-methyltransferase [Chitinophaga pinensis DSM 2588]